MKPNELIKILDSGVVTELTIYYCGGHITVRIDSCPFELPDYDICKLWNSENGRGVSVLLADKVIKEETASKEQRAAKIPDKISDDDAKNAIYLLGKYCRQNHDGCKSCIFNFGIGKCGIYSINNIIVGFRESDAGQRQTAD